MPIRIREEYRARICPFFSRWLLASSSRFFFEDFSLRSSSPSDTCSEGKEAEVELVSRSRSFMASFLHKSISSNSSTVISTLPPASEGDLFFLEPMLTDASSPLPWLTGLLPWLQLSKFTLRAWVRKWSTTVRFAVSSESPCLNLPRSRAISRNTSAEDVNVVPTSFKTLKPRRSSSWLELELELDSGIKLLDSDCITEFAVIVFPVPGFPHK